MSVGRMFTPPGRDEYYTGAYEEKKPMSEPYNWMVGPTGYSKGVSYSGANPIGTLASGLFTDKPMDVMTARSLREGIDWRKAVQGIKYGSKQGAKIGSFFGPVYGTGAGAGVGAWMGGGLGSTFVEGPKGTEGMGPAAAQKSDPGSDYAGWQPYFKWFDKGTDYAKAGRSLGNLSMGTGSWGDIFNIFRQAAGAGGFRWQDLLKRK